MKISDIWRPDEYDFVVNPFPVYEQLRKKSSVFESPTGDFVVLSYQDVRQILADKTCLTGIRKDWMNRAIAYAKKKGQDYEMIQKVMEAMLFQLNPSIHTELRMWLMKYWPSKTWIEEKSEILSHEIVLNIPKECNLVDEVSRKLPLMVINELLGSNFGTVQNMKDSIVLLRTLDPYLTVKDLEEINHAAIRFYGDFHSFYNSLPREGKGLAVIIKQNEAQLIQWGLDPVSVLMFVFLAAQDTTANLISASIFTLLKDKSLIALIQTDQLMDNFVHEMLRLHSPVQLTERINQNELTIGNRVIPPHSILSLCIGAANRDSDQFENPHDLDIYRHEHRHVSFGYGIHHCLGNQMVLTETSIVLKHILPKLSNYHLSGEVMWDKRLTIRNINTIPVTDHV